MKTCDYDQIEYAKFYIFLNYSFGQNRILFRIVKKFKTSIKYLKKALCVETIFYTMINLWKSLM